MAILHTADVGASWVIEATLTDDDDDPITALNNAWLKIYNHLQEVIVEKELADAEMDLASNVLTTTISPTETELIDFGYYYLDLKVETSGGVEEVVNYRERVLARQTPTSDDH